MPCSGRGQGLCFRLDPAPPGPQVGKRGVSTLNNASVLIRKSSQVLRHRAQAHAAPGDTGGLCGLHFLFCGGREMVLATVGTDCPQHSPWDTHLPRSSLVPGQDPPRVQGSGHGWEDGGKAGNPSLWVHRPAQLLCPWGDKDWGPFDPPRFGRSAPGRQGWEGARACPEPPQDEEWHNLGFRLV